MGSWDLIVILASGKLSHNYGKSSFLMDTTISMVMFNSYLKLPEGNLSEFSHFHATHMIDMDKPIKNSFRQLVFPQIQLADLGGNLKMMQILRDVHPWTS